MSTRKLSATGIVAAFTAMGLPLLAAAAARRAATRMETLVHSDLAHSRGIYEAYRSSRE